MEFVLTTSEKVEILQDDVELSSHNPAVPLAENHQDGMGLLQKLTLRLERGSISHQRGSLENHLNKSADSEGIC